MGMETFTRAAAGGKRKSVRIKTAIFIAAMAGDVRKSECTATVKSTLATAGGEL